MSVRRFRPRRPAFTLVELLVVILIIAILVSLVSSAVMMALGKIPQVRTSTEIAQLTVAVQAFMQDHNLSTPPPSQLLLYENIAAYKTDLSPLAQQTFTFLQKAFGKNVGLGTPFIDWNGNGSPDALPWYLEGEQCLVFYCGGIPSLGGMQGLSSNNMNPAFPGGKRLGPYYDFQISRLVLWPGLAPFPVYIDAWEVKASKKPYAYFSSQGTNNNYANLGNGYLLVDCAGIGASPYAQSYVLSGPDPVLNKAVTYVNPNGFQIISAGKDGLFAQCQDSAGIWGMIAADWSSVAGGPFAPWPAVPTIGVPAIPNFNSGGAAAMNDDQANFSAGPLGQGQQ